LTIPVNKILILFAHPRFEKSRVNRALLKNIEYISGVTLHDLYEEYPDFNVDVELEKTLLTSHQIIIWHHPFHMYGAPALLKQWMDLVLEYGWALGSKGNALKDKIISAGRTHLPGGGDHLCPHHQTARHGNRFDAYDLMDMGIRDIYRESFDTSVRLGIDVLVKLGYLRYSAYRAGQNFTRYDEAAMHKLAPHRYDERSYIFNAKEQIQLQEQLLTNDREANPTLNDHAWDSDLFINPAADDRPAR
jgi:hypothetical protein